MLTDNKTRVGTLRVRVPRSEATAARLALSSQLRAAELRPATLPPSAILVVRQVTDPLPGRVSSQPGSLRPDRQWEAAARDALALAHRQAARPAREAVPANAEAVLFADDAELLACLALDVRRGQARERWWWRTFPRAWTTAQPEALQALFCDRPAAVPAALHRLAQVGAVWSVVEYLRPPQAKKVLAAVAWAFGLPSFEVGEGSSPPSPRRDAPLPSRTHGERGTRTAEIASASGATPSGAAEAIPAPWESWLPAVLVPASATREAVCLVGIALGLFRDPPSTRRPAFATGVRSWLNSPPAITVPRSRDASVLDLADRHLPPPDLRPTDSPGKRRPEVSASEPPERVLPAMTRVPEPVEDTRICTPNGEEAASPEDRPIAPVVDPAKRRIPLTPKGSDDPASPSDSTPSELTWTNDDRPVSHRAPNARIPDNVTNSPALSPANAPPITPRHRAEGTPRRVGGETARIPTLADGVTTRLGGVLFLINFMIHLDLPACFELDWELESRVGSWGVLELLGRALVRRDAATFGDDPIWTALRALDGRAEGTLPRAPRQPPTAPSLPARWLDRVAGGSPSRRRSMALAPGRTGRVSPLLASLSDPAREWLELVVPYIQARLRRSLAVGPARRVSLDTTLLRRTSRLYVSDLHVDLVLPLDDVSIPVRLAGLDLDPGWLPGFGRVVKFHYE